MCKLKKFFLLCGLLFLPMEVVYAQVTITGENQHEFIYLHGQTFGKRNFPVVCRFPPNNNRVVSGFINRRGRFVPAARVRRMRATRIRNRLQRQGVSDQVIRQRIRRMRRNVIRPLNSQCELYRSDAYSLEHHRDHLTPEEARYLIRRAYLGRNSDALTTMATQPGGLHAVLNHFFRSETSSSCRNVESRALELATMDMTRLASNVSGVRYFTDDNIRWNSNAFATYWIHMMRYGCEPQRELTALLYHNHFSVDIGVFNNRNDRHHYISQYSDLLRGEFPEAGGGLLAPLDKKVAYLHGWSGAMLFWLDNRFNTLGEVNENYGRELSELFTIGVNDPITGMPNYEERDIWELAYTLTGYTEKTESVSYHACCDTSNSDCGVGGPVCRDINVTVRSPKFDNDRWNHDTRPIRYYLFESQPYGRYDVWKANFKDLDNVTPYLFNEVAPVRRHLAARFLQHYGNLDLTEHMLTTSANMLQAHGFNPEGVLRTILGSKMFYSKQVRAAGIWDPVSTTMSFIRTLDLPLGRGSGYNLYSRLRIMFQQMGMTLGRPTTVFGWQTRGKTTGGEVHNGSVFINQQGILGGINGMVNIVGDIERGRADSGFDWFDLLPSNPQYVTPSGVVDHLAEKLAISVTPAERELLIEFMSNVALERENSSYGYNMPIESSIVPVNWTQIQSELSSNEWENFMRLKISGLVTILYGMASNHIGN